jgi:hypothetical protein
MKFNFKEGLKWSLISIPLFFILLLMEGFILGDFSSFFKDIDFLYELIRLESVIIILTFIIVGIDLGDENE